MTDFANDGEAKRWNYRPGKPVALNPLFTWPPRPGAVLRWYASFWFEISTTTFALLMAVLAVATWMPSVTDTGHLALGWVLAVWLGLLLPQIIVTGGLHHWLYNRQGQGRDLKYDKRDLALKSRQFTFGNQVHDNMFWTLASGITIGTVYTVLWYWAAGNGWVAIARFEAQPVWFILYFALIPVWGSFHFYWVHRLMHWPPLYKLAHALHHRNVNVGPWSGISMHPVEHVIYFSSWGLFFILPTHPLHLMFHAYLYTLHPVFSHSGFDALVRGDKKQMELGDFFHQLHHRYFECNYGTVEMPWDRWFGTFHDGSASGTEDTKARQRRMYQGRTL